MKLFSVLLIAACVAHASPDDIRSKQSVELIEEVKPHEYTQRTVEIPFMQDATATVCLRGLDIPKDQNAVKCFYKMHDSDEIVVLNTRVFGEVRT